MDGGTEGRRERGKAFSLSEFITCGILAHLCGIGSVIVGTV